MAAHGALASLVNVIEEIITHPRLYTSSDYRLLQSLIQKAASLLDFIHSFDHGGIMSEEAEHLERMTTRAAYAAEDAIKTHIADLIHLGTAKGSPSCSLNLQQAIDSMDAILKKADELREQGRLREEEQPAHSKTPMAMEVEEEKTAMMGFEEELAMEVEEEKTAMMGFEEELIQILVHADPQSSRDVISIVGMGGMDKTTLARNVFRHRRINERFDVCAWATVSRNYDREEILSQLLGRVGGILSQLLGRVVGRGGELYKYLFGRRYLIILDDIWSVGAWDEVRPFLPRNGNGSRVVLTTRSSSVARCCSLNLHRATELMDDILKLAVVLKELEEAEDDMVEFDQEELLKILDVLTHSCSRRNPYIISIDTMGEMEPTLSHPLRISEASGRNISGDLLKLDMNLSSISNQNATIEQDAADYQETGDGDASVSSYTTSKKMEKKTGKIEEDAAYVEELRKKIEKKTGKIEEDVAYVEELRKKIEKKTGKIEEDVAYVEELRKKIEKKTGKIEEDAAYVEELRKKIKKKTGKIEEDVAYVEELRKKIEKTGKIEGDAAYVEELRKKIEKTGKKGKTDTEAKPGVSLNEVLDIERYLDDFILFCSVLPCYYEFTRDILVSQWIIGGLINLGKNNMIEEVCTKCFDTLVERDYIVPSEYDFVFNQMKYKIGGGKKFDSKVITMSGVEHVSLAFKELGVPKKYSCLQTLVIYDSYGVDHLPSDIFLELKTLKILNLSGTNVAVLPGSIENLKELQFFDMSKTPIRWLPETISNFSHLHTLNLDGCSKLECLPKCTNKLINLQHLVVNVSRLSSMPIGMGNLSNLRTLNVFSVGVGDGHRVTELKNLNKLRGSFSLLNLENVRSKEEALEACLYKKEDLRKIELHWSDIQDKKCVSEDRILEYLRPPFSTQELKILFYSGGVFPSWFGDPSFSELTSIALHDCKYCYSLPTLGDLPSLKCLSIAENHAMTDIGSLFFTEPAYGSSYRSRVAFPKLERLSFDSMSKLKKWSGYKVGDFPSLRLLIIEYCPELMGFWFLSRLSSLSGLEIRYCPELSSLLEGGIPSSLESLLIKQSTKLKAHCDEHWSKVAHVPSIFIDDQEVSLKNSE